MSAPLRPKPLRVLITGVTRTLGRQLADQLYYDERVQRIVGIALDPELPYYFRNFDQERFTYRMVNLNRYRSVVDFMHSRLMREAGVNTVVHLALKGDPQRYGQPDHQLNIEGTKFFLDLCLQNPSITQFVYLSSASVYKLGPRMDVLIDETADLNFDPAAHPMLRDAVGAELLCRAKMDNEQCNIVVLRPSGIVGRNINSLINHLFESIVCFVPAGFDPMINPIHALDVLRAIKEAMFQEVRGVFNIAGPDIGPLSAFLRLTRGRAYPVPRWTLQRLYRTARQLGMTRFQYELNPQRLQYSLVLDTSKIRRKMGFVARQHIKFG